MKYVGCYPGGVGGWRACLLYTALTLSSGFCTGAAAAEPEKSNAPKTQFEAEFFLAVGGFFPTIDSTVSLGPSNGGSGQEIDVEKVLGVESDNSSVWIHFDWRFEPRHQFQVEWFDLNRNGGRSASKDFTVGDTDILAGASVSSKLDFNLGRLTYGYSFIRNENLDVAVLAGFHVATLKLTVSAAGSLVIDGVPVANGSSTESSSTYTVPLPHIGGALTYKISPRWTTQFTLLGFALDLGEFSGYLVEADAMVGYQISKNFGLGTGLKYFKINLEAQGDRGEATFNYQFFGPAIYGYATF